MNPNVERFEMEQSSQISLHAPYSSKISSPLKLSYIPETISEAEEENQVDQVDDDRNGNEDNSIKGHSRTNNSSELDNNLLEYIESTEFQASCNKGQPENLFEPINRLKGILKSQPLEPNDSSKSDVQETEAQIPKNCPRSSDNSSDNTTATGTTYADTTHTDTTQTDTIQTDIEFQDSEEPLSQPNDMYNLSLRKRRVPPISLISADIRQVRSRVQRTNAYGIKLSDRHHCCCILC